MSTAPSVPQPNEKREEFLISMYERMWENISRSITLSWQPFVVLLALGAIFNVSLAGVIPVWFATSIAFIVVGWFFGHIYDANEWVWRNHLIVANLERYFLNRQDDRGLINPYLGDLVAPQTFKFKPLRKLDKTRLFSTLKPHFFFAWALTITVCAFEVFFDWIPIKKSGAWPKIAGAEMHWLVAVPIVTAVLTAVWVLWFRHGRNKQYKDTYKIAAEARQK